MIHEGYSFRSTWATSFSQPVAQGLPQHSYRSQLIVRTFTIARYYSLFDRLFSSLKNDLLACLSSPITHCIQPELAKIHRLSLSRDLTFAPERIPVSKPDAEVYSVIPLVGNPKENPMAFSQLDESQARTDWSYKAAWLACN